MAWSFTAATERALNEAAGWRSQADRDDLDTPELLLGLLAESECRAAQMLLACGVDVATVSARWPTLARHANGARRDFSPALAAAIEAAIDRLWAYPKPLHLATEHVLLGLAAAPGETARWLAEHGLVADQLEAQIHQLYGHDPGPVSVEQPLEVPESEPATAMMNTARRMATAVPPEKSVLHRERQAAGSSPADYIATTSSSSPTALLRLLDAAANRAREGLRVVEDYVRMVLDDRYLTSELKQLRHELHNALRPLEYGDLLAARDTLGDVGTQVTTANEFARPDLASVATANWKRLQEALRSLEEYAKVSHPAEAAAIERLRYRSYTLERAAEIVRSSLARLAGAQLCVLVDGRSSADEFASLVDDLVAGGASMIQLRDKKLTDVELLARAILLRERTSAAGCVCIVNDRADIASASGADGVHLGQDDLPISAARAILGPRALIGRSTHSIEQARQAVLEGANYIGVGPTFPSSTKQFDSFTGVELLHAVAHEIRLPAFAIGGVGPVNLDAVLQAGFTRIAVSGAVAAAAEPQQAARELSRRLNHGS
jgi:thiamine-phosphate pyrophosphorylase